MPQPAGRTIRIRWVRSGIGFTHRQKEMIRSLGLRRLNQIVERPDSPQIRGLVARIPRLVEIVDALEPSPWALLPEYTIRPPEAAPTRPAVAKAKKEEAAGVEEVQAPTEPTAAKPSVRAAKAAKLAAKPTPRTARTKAKAAEKTKKTEDKPAKAKAAKPAKKEKGKKK